jgi:hypothetical protein
MNLGWIPALAKAILRACGRNAFVLSLWEAVFVLIFSNSFLMFLVFVHVLSTPKESLSLDVALRVIRSDVTPAEYLVYILAIVAPAFWIMLYHWRARRHPLVYSVLLIALGVIIVTSAYIYGKAKVSNIENMEFATSWSTACYVVGLVTWYVTLVYDKWLKTLVVPLPPVSGAQVLQELGEH